MAAAPRSPGSPTLVLVPTELEARRLADAGGLGRGLALEALCGFGPVAAAARAAGLLERLRPRRVLLVGIAGAYDTDAHPVGSALCFARVAIEGIGAGEGEHLVAPPALGFPQWPGPTPGGRTIEDELALARPRGLPSEPTGLLLTTCAASADAEQAARRRRRHPSAVAEDMEGFAVACACALAGVPLAVVRGVSNAVGERDPARWRIPAALQAARELALVALDGPAPWREEPNG